MSIKRKVLVLYVYDNQHEFVETTTSLMLSKGVPIDALCVPTYRYSKNTSIHWPWIVYLASFFINKLHFRKFGSLMYKAFKKKLIKSIIDNYDIVDFQSFPSSQYELADYCIKSGKDYLICFWGSDILRANNNEMAIIAKALPRCKSIRLNKQMRDKIDSYCVDLGMDLEQKFTGEIDGKTTGHKDISTLDNLTSKDILSCKDIFAKGNSQKILVTIGYNGSPAQNQNKVIELLSKLPADIKNKIHLVIPMTYGTPKGYFDTIRQLAYKSGISYVVLDHFLSNKEVCVLRTITNVFIMVQDTDGFAASVRAHVYCQNICLFGDWIDYPMEDQGVFYIKVNWDNLFDKFVDVIANYSDYQKKSLPNKIKIHPFMSWDNYVNMMSELYKQ